MYSSQVFIQESPPFEKATPSGNEQSQMDQAALCGCNQLVQERTKYKSYFGSGEQYLHPWAPNAA